MARNNPARKFFEFILAGVGQARKKSKFSLPGPVSSRQNVLILAKMLQNEPIPHTGEENIILIPRWGALARKLSF